jgi:ABC-type bacteriocin/lantibiotic exporter with double-glycine peptidase domain
MLRASAFVLLLLFTGFSAVAGGVWLDVPFVKQPEKGCGAASIAMVLRYWKQNAQPAIDALEIQKVLYSKEAEGIYATDMEKYFLDHGFRTYVFSGKVTDLEHHLSNGRPLIVCLGQGKKPLHYVVVAGLDFAEHVVLINDPAERKLMKIPQEEFEQKWNVKDRWTLLAVPQHAE